MNRLKFLLFALVALGLWGYHLVLVAPAATGRSVELASASAAGVPSAVALRLEARRSLVQAAAVRMAQGAGLMPTPKTPPARPEAPPVERLNALRAVALEVLGEDGKTQAVVGVANEAGSLVSIGAGEGTAAPEGLNVQALTAAAGSGAMLDVLGTPHLFYSVPLVGVDKGEPKVVGVAFVGLPLLPDAKAMADQVAKELQVVSVGIVSGGTLIGVAGDKALLEKASKLKPGTVGAVAEGTVDSLGPLALPMFVAAPSLDIGVHRAIAGTPYSVVAVSSVRASMQDLAGYQKFGFGGLLGLLFLSVVVAFLIKSSDEHEGPGMVAPPPVPAPPRKKETPESEPGSSPQPAGRPGSTAAQPVFQPAASEAAHPAAPEVSPDDFHFPASPSPAPVAPPAPTPPPAPVAHVEEPQSDPFAHLGAEPATRANPPPTASPEAGVYRPPPAATQPHTYSPAALATPFDEPGEEEGGRTMAYPAFKPPPSMMAEASGAAASDPFAMAAAQLGTDDQGQQSPEDNPDATRVAMVPQELIKAARASGPTGMTAERPALKPTSSAPAVPRVASAPVSEEDKHFQDVFRDFIATREKCGEPADGLTFEKFKAKLLKNKEQLVAKYNCKSVRFQVYVKEGKAALKASPVKE